MVDFQKLYREFKEEVSSMKTKSFRESLLEKRMGAARHFQVSVRAYFDPSTGGNIEDKLIRLRSIDGVTIVTSDPTESENIYLLKIKFHPEFESMRPATYVRTVLIPGVNASKKVPGVRITSIIHGSLRSVTQ